MKTVSESTFMVTGAGGQLGREFVDELKRRNIECHGFGKSDLDITDEPKVREAVGRIRPGIVINCAAYNLVEEAETNKEKSLSVNAEAVGSLASVCKENNAVFVHFGSDYVFDGEKKAPYVEGDKPNPINVYGQSKLAGEEAIAESKADYLIFRVSWVFGNGRQNFLFKLSEWAKNREQLQIVNDQFSVATSTQDIVDVALMALEAGLRGLWHLTNSGTCSRYDLAKYYFERIGSSVDIQPVGHKTFPSEVKRPASTCMSNKRLANELKIEIPNWKDAVDRFVQKKYAMEQKR